MDNRRDFLKKMAMFSGALGVSSVVPPAIQRAMAISPSAGSTFLDAEYVVFLMQENRSFDHCFGSLKGVRGFNDPHALRFENNKPIWFQQSKEGKTFAPFRLNIKDTKATWMSSLPHAWDNQVDAHNNGKMDQWLDAKRSGNDAYADMPLTMGYYNRDDIPFYYALADAFTICDQYFCSSLTGTSPNRSYFWSGTIRPQNSVDAKAHVWNDDIDTPESLEWTTYPERLQKHGIDWKIYQNELSVGVGFEGEEDYLLGNFTDNTIENFKAYNVRLHQAHINFLHQAKLKLGQEAERLQKTNDAAALRKNREKLDKLLAEFEKIGDRTFESLSDEEKELHRRAFVTNINDPYYHQLAVFEYEENGEKRSLKVPKGDILHQFRADVDNGKLPMVSWLVAPCMFSDHPSAPWFGAWYLSEIMDILTKNPEIWKKTIFILTYDENDGYFDHVPPFVAPNPEDIDSGKVSDKITDWKTEYVSFDQKQGPDEWSGKNKRSSPIGLGYRVPTIVASPWTRGGYVNSQVFDHTSCLQFLEYFIEKKTGKKISETNITNWRRALCGNMVSVFRPYYGEHFEALPFVKKEPFVEEIFNAKFKKEPQNFVPVPKPDQNWISTEENKYLPRQEKGHKPANALPYELYADVRVQSDSLQLVFAAKDKYFKDRASGAGFLLYSDTPFKGANGKVENRKNWAFTVGVGEELNYKLNLNQFESDIIQLKLYGPNGFYRFFKFSRQKNPALRLDCKYEENAFMKPTGNVILKIQDILNEVELQITNLHTQQIQSVNKIFKPHQNLEIVLQGSKEHCWYDWLFKSPQFPDWEMRYAGRVETGKDGITDPMMGM